MKPIHVRISGLAKIIDGDDTETLFQIWMATKNIKQPYRIVQAAKTGDGDHYIIMDAA